MGRASSKTERERRRAEVVSLHLSGKTQSAIAHELGVSEATVSNDLAIARQRWAECSSAGLEHKRGEELARLDRLEAEAWAAWRKSCGPITRTKTTPNSGGPVNTTIDQAGDVRYLGELRRIIETRAELCGLLHRGNVAIATAGTTSVVEEIVTIEDLRAAAETIRQDAIAQGAQWRIDPQTKQLPGVQSLRADEVEPLTWGN